MDVALGLDSIFLNSHELVSVLILVVMDVALGHCMEKAELRNTVGLNPCCNGCRTWAVIVAFASRRISWS